MMTKKWTPSLRAGTAFDANNFSIALGQIELDDPFSVILTYNGSIEQPWGRIDVQREIKSLVAMPKKPGSIRPAYTAMSNEGDVYFIDENDLAVNDKIPGSGVDSEDALGRGEMFSLRLTSKGLFAVGDGNQIYHKVNREWQDVSPDMAKKEGYDPTAWTDLAELSGGQIAIVGMTRKPLTVPKLVEDDSEWENMSADEFLARFNAASEASAAIGPESIGTVSIMTEDGWRKSKVPEVGDLSAIFVDSRGSVWVCGEEEVLLFSENGTSFRTLIEEEEGFLFNSITEFQGEIVLTHDEGISIYRDSELLPLKPHIDPSVSGGIPSPLRVQAVDDVLYYFDHSHGVSIWNGETWSRIEIPAPLLEREFPGPSSLK